MIDKANVSSFTANTTTNCHSLFLNDEFGNFANAISGRLEESKMEMNIGSTLATTNLSIDAQFFADPDAPIYSHIDKYRSEINAAIIKQTSLSPKHLSKIWNIKEDLADKAMAQTTHLLRRGLDNELSKRYSTNDRMLRYKQINSQFYTDTLFV